MSGSDLYTQELPVDAAYSLRPLPLWPLVLFVSLAFSVLALIGAGLVLDRRAVGALAVSKGCSPGLAMGYGMIVLAGALTGLARIALERRMFHVLQADAARAATLAIVPMIGLIMTVPGAIGCGVASRVTRLGAAGEALLGTAGATVAGACAFGLGMALLSMVRVLPPPGLIAAQVDALRAEDAAPLDVVEAALARHDLLD